MNLNEINRIRHFGGEYTLKSEIKKMKKIIYFTFSLLIFFSCGSTKRFSKELSIKELEIRNLVPHPYKRNYIKIINYLYKNHRKDFIEIKGDFFNIKFGDNSAYNFMVGYQEDYDPYKTSLVVMISTSDNSVYSIKMNDVKVTSSKFGDLSEVSKAFRNYPPVLFIRKINVPSRYDIIELIKDDVITITIDGIIYEFVKKTA
jgi:hypothetical protein